jgi:MYXO-CTERM domain-containing protein
LQSWTRDDSNGGIEPDWLRIGTDITGQGPFNAAFVLNGVAVPGPIAGAGIPGLVAAIGVLMLLARRRRQRFA